MKNRKNHKPRRLSPFERETERRRKEMLRNIAGAKPKITPAFLRSMPKQVRKLFVVKPEVRA